MNYLEIADPARCAYAALAPYYDRFTGHQDYRHWLAQIESRAVALGLGGRRALDVACGTGTSFAPLLDRGYEVSACDLSPEMVDQARAKFDGRLEDLFVADMRELPAGGEFDLVTCLDDAVNYLLAPDDLLATFQSVARRLAPGGIFVFDVNSLLTYRTAFAQTFIREDDGGLFCWHGEATGPIEPGDAASARIEAFIETDDALWERVSSRHVQRHHPSGTIRAALDSAGLEHLASTGQRPGGRLEDHVDEAEHIKVVYFAGRRRRDHQGEVS